MHCNAQKLRGSTNFMSMSPASSVNLPARISSKVQPFPPQPVVIASFHTAATFSRSDASLIFIKLGKSSAISATPYTDFRVVVIILYADQKPQIPSTKFQRSSKLQCPRDSAFHIGV